ncbi:MAG: type II secretion system protein [Planctomycetota bacterium]|jgi:prepilin-type N-terminal cleavage/methylation domain-containing protein
MTRASGISRNRRRPPGRGGFTLVEAVACMAILAVLAVISSNLIMASVETLLDSSVRCQLHNELSIALDRLVRETRNIERDASASGKAPDIDNVTAASLVWTDSDDHAYSVSLSGSDLMLVADGGTAAILLSDVDSLAIETYDRGNAALAATLSGESCDAIRRVRITVTMTRQGVTESLSAYTFIRSMLSGA